MKYYFAYGSNLWLDQMQSRCPDSHVIEQAKLAGYRWIITDRGYASILQSPLDHVLGTIFNISEKDELNLDRFESVAAGHYGKFYLDIEVKNQPHSCLVYIDRSKIKGQPKTEYITRINNGLADAKFSDQYVRQYIRPFVPA